MAIVFESTLGYNADNAADLEARIKEGLGIYKAISLGDNGHGEKYNVVMLIHGPKWIQPVRTAWIFAPESDEPRMVTAYVDKDRRP